MFFERRCPGCGASAPALCPHCRATLVPVLAARPLEGLDALTGRCRYEGAGRAAVLALKNRGRRDLARWWAGELACLAGPADVVTWVPASRSGRRDRGYDQAALLARAVARLVDRPAVPLLDRPRRAGSQRGRSRDQRLAGVGFVARRAVSGRVLLVDDVVTTGSSLSCGAVALRGAGAASVVGLVIAVADRDL